MQGEVIALAQQLVDKLSQLRNTRFRANEEIEAVERELGIALPQSATANVVPLSERPDRLPAPASVEPGVPPGEYHARIVDIRPASRRRVGRPRRQGRKRA